MNTLTQHVRIVDVATPLDGNVISPMAISPYSSLSVPAYFRAMNFIADNLASFPRAVRKENATVKHTLDSMLRRRPNAYQNPFVLWRTWFFHAAHTANGFIRVERDKRTQRPIGLHIMLAHDVFPFRYDQGDGTGVQQYYAQLSTKSIYAGADVCHLQGLSWDGMSGMDPVSLHAQTFQRASTIDRYSTHFLMKGTVIRGAIEIPNSITPEQLAMLKSELKTHFTGPSADRDIIILWNGGKLNNATLTPEESQLVEQGGYSTKQIAQITGVPPEFLFELSEAKYNTSVEQAGQTVVRYLFRTWIEQAEDELTLKLLTTAEQDAGLTISINPDALLRGDTKTQTDTVVAKVNGGIATRNEGRNDLGLPPDADPESDKLKTLGDSTPKTPEPAAGKSEPTKAGYTTLKPIIDSTCARIDTKTAKAFENASGKKGQERTIWVNVFAEQQSRYAADALAPIAESLAAMGCAEIDTAAIGEKYAARIRKMASTGEQAKLVDLVNA